MHDKKNDGALSALRRSRSSASESLQIGERSDCVHHGRQRLQLDGAGRVLSLAAAQSRAESDGGAPLRVDVQLVVLFVDSRRERWRVLLREQVMD